MYYSYIYRKNTTYRYIEKHKVPFGQKRKEEEIIYREIVLYC